MTFSIRLTSWMWTMKKLICKVSDRIKPMSGIIQFISESRHYQFTSNLSSRAMSLCSLIWWEPNAKITRIRPLTILTCSCIDTDIRAYRVQAKWPNGKWNQIGRQKPLSVCPSGRGTHWKGWSDHMPIRLDKKNVQSKIH